MRSTPKPTLIATIMFLCICCAQFADVQGQPEGRMEISASRDPRTCCPNKPSCCVYVFEIKLETKCESIGDMGVLLEFPKDSTPVVEDVSFEIYSVNDELVYSAKTQVLSLRATDNSTGY